MVSNIDFVEDGRGFALLDYDQDGWVDLALVSPNAPRFRLIRNQIGKQLSEHRVLTIRLVGGNTRGTTSKEWSARDAYGAVVAVDTDQGTRAFQLACGSGLSSQNEKAIRVGLGTKTVVQKITVHWPSGKQTVVTKINSDNIVIQENTSLTGTTQINQD